MSDKAANFQRKVLKEKNLQKAWSTIAQQHLKQKQKNP